MQEREKEIVEGTLPAFGENTFSNNHLQYMRGKLELEATTKKIGKKSSKGR